MLCLLRLGRGSGGYLCQVVLKDDLGKKWGVYDFSRGTSLFNIGHEQPIGSNAPVNNWLGIKLVPSDDNASSLGAIITLETSDGSPLGTQYIDGGSGFGGQTPQIPVFGLGDYSGSVVVKVYWPLGREKSITVPATTNAVVEVHADSDLQILDSTIQTTLEFDPATTLIHWTFTWQSDYWSAQDLDRVTINVASGQNCGPSSVTVQAGDPDVTVQKPYYYYDSATGLFSFKHKLEWVDQTCHPMCGYSIEVESSNGTVTGTGVYTPGLRIKTCPTGLGGP